MMTDLSPRLGLPLLAAGQAQKEVLHNEALVVLEAMAQPVAESVGDDIPPSAPAVGSSWIVGAAPSGAWTGQPGRIATWTAGGWRFTPPREGMCFWASSSSCWAQRISGSWTLGIFHAAAVHVGGQQVVAARQAGIADPSGGAAVDAEARAAIVAILGALRGHGLIASA